MPAAAALFVVPFLWAAVAARAPRRLPQEASGALLRQEPKFRPELASLALLQRKQQLTAVEPALVDGGTKQPSIVYGVMTNGLPEYREKLISQAETWAAGLPEQRRFFAVSGSGTPPVASLGLIVEDRCPDDTAGLSCKEERLMEEGYDRGADWFVVLGEDNYVNRARLEGALRKHSESPRSAAPAVLGVHGCGKNVGFCPEVTEMGGICGGATYALNRAALEVLMSQGKEALRQEYMAKVMPGDMASSCALRRRGVKFEQLDGLAGNRIEKAADFISVLSGRPLALHYCTPNVMRWVHATMQHSSDTEVRALQAAAFDGGCCCSYQDADLEHCKEEVRASASQIQLEGPPKTPLWSRFKRAYIKERDRQLAEGL